MAARFPTLGLEVVLRGVGGYVAGAGTILQTNKRLAQSVSRTATGLGTKLSLGLTLPIVGAGLAISKFGLDYERELTNIDALTDTTTEQVDELRGNILDLSREIGRSPAELGAGAYFILSSGITDTADALEVLEAAGKAAALGLGETKTIADLTTSVMNSYQLGVEDVNRVMDTLIGIVKLGKGEADAFASSIGFVIPLASQMGVSFEELGAVLATLTLGGLDPAEATTAARGILAQLLSPSEKAKEVFKEMGTTVGDFRDLVRKDFIGAMAALAAATGGDETVFGEIFPDIRGLTGVLSAFGNQQERTIANFAAIEAGSGAFDESVATLEKSPGHKLEVALNELKVALTILGVDLLPTFISLLEDAQPIIKGFGKAAQAFSDLPAPVRTAVIGLVAFLAVLGPILFVVGAIASGISILITVVGALAGAVGLIGALAVTFGVLSLPVLLVVAALVALGVAVFLVIKYWDQIVAASEKVLDFFQEHWPTIIAFLVLPFIVGPLLIIKAMLAHKSQIEGIAQTVIDFFKGNWQIIGRLLLAAFTLGLSEIIIAVATWWDEISSFLQDIPGVMRNFGAAIPGQIAVGFAAAAPALLQTVQNAVGQMIEDLNPFNWEVGSTLSETYSKAGKEAGDAMFGSLEDSMVQVEDGSWVPQSFFNGNLVEAYQQAGREAGTGFVDALEIAIGRATGIPNRVFGDIISAARDFVESLQSEMGRLLGQSTVESAGRNLKLSKLRLKIFPFRNLDENVSALEDEQAALEEERDTTARGNVVRVAAIQTRLKEIEVSKNMLKRREKERDALQEQIDKLEDLEEKRRLELDILRARGVVADKTLLTDNELNSALERMIRLIGTATGKIREQVGVIRSQYIPSINDTAAATAGAAGASDGLARGLGNINDEYGKIALKTKPDGPLRKGMQGFNLEVAVGNGLLFATDEVTRQYLHNLDLIRLAQAEVGRAINDTNLEVAVQNALFSGQLSGAQLQGRQHGGPVTAGVPYLVGERRPEVFIPSVSGAIIPSLQSFLSRFAGGGSDVTVEGGFKNFGTQIFQAGEDPYAQNLLASMVRAAS